MTRLGFKKLTITSWLESDEISTRFGKRSPDGDFVTARADDWAEAFLEPQLLEVVPGEVRDLFEVARGVLLYGYFFYPLYMLGFEQLFRVGEAAITHKNRQLRGPENQNFYRKILCLEQQGAISSDQAQRWQDARKLRNMASHATQQAVLPPGMVLGLLDAMARDINVLFS